MRRRTIAAIAVFVPVAIVGVLKYFFPLTYDWLDGYMVVIALAFKAALLSFFSASKLKFITFLKGLTLLQGVLLLVKRWFLDNVFARWLKRNITDHIKGAFGDLFAYYRTLNIRTKFKNIFIPLILTVGSIWAAYSTGYLDNLLLFTEFKVVIIGLSKTFLAIGLKLFGFMVDSWITPILEVFALSYILSALERLLGHDHPVIRGINWLGAKLNALFLAIATLNRRHIDPLLNDHVAAGSRTLADKLLAYVRDKKIDYEYEQFDRLEKKILDGHIDAYYQFKGMELITDKRELYTRINHATRDHLDIVAYVSRNKKGDLLPENIPDSFYHDVFLLEGIASSSQNGVKEEIDGHPDHTDFWVLNTSRHPVALRTHSGHISTQEIAGQSLVMIESDHAIDYHEGDIVFEYKGRTETVVPIIRA